MTDLRDDGPADAGHQARAAAALIDAAQAAVGNGDYVQGERLLREAATIQETSLGESHPDLATTLNNLAFVCEQTGKFDEAERGYRRAHRIAVASLSPGHPFVKTSLSNLMDFCEARGIPIWTRPETPVEDEPLPDDVGIESSLHDEGSAEVADSEPPDVEPDDVAIPTIDVPPEIVREPAAAEILLRPAAASRLPLRMMAVAALGIAAVVVFAFSQPGQETSDETRASAHARTTTVSSAPAPDSAPAPGVPTPVASAPVTSAASEIPATVPPRAPEPTVAPMPRPAATGANATVTVLTAQLCRALVRSGSPDWQCTSAGSEVPPGRYTFYTRLLASSDTRVEHRWYFNGRVHQTMRLPVSENPGSGYRTYSTTTVSPERAGEWKVELRAADGTVLAQESFFVR